MSASEQQFRSAAFGGFQKQDVLNYIETTNKEHAAKLEELQKELEELKSARTALETERDELSAKQSGLSAELEEAAAALEWANSEMERKDTLLTGLQEENAAMKTKVAALEPDAQAYLAVKDRMAGIELEAHCRAQAAEAAAQEHVKKIKSDMEQWMLKVQAGYDRLRTDVDATISHADGELERVSKTLAGISTEFSDHDAALEGLLRAYRESQFPAAPLPLKVEGE